MISVFDNISAMTEPGRIVAIYWGLPCGLAGWLANVMPVFELSTFERDQHISKALFSIGSIPCLEAINREKPLT